MSRDASEPCLAPAPRGDGAKRPRPVAGRGQSTAHTRAQPHDARQRARPRTNSTNVPTGTPVGPRGTVPRSDSVYAVPAMSRCTHGYPSANSLRKSAAVIVPAGRPPEFLMSATSDLISSL